MFNTLGQFFHLCYSNRRLKFCKFKIVTQSSIAAGVRRVEALRDKQLEEYLTKKEKLSDLSLQKNEEIIKNLSEEIIKLGGKPNLDNKNQKDPKIFENLNSNKETETKEQEMFEETNLEEDFEIPAFLRRQKN